MKDQITMHDIHENAKEVFHSCVDMKQGTTNSNSGEGNGQHMQRTGIKMQFSRHVQMARFLVQSE